MKTTLVLPYGSDTLVDLVCSADEHKRYIEIGSDLMTYALNERQLGDLELLLNGGFTPLNGYLNRENYDSVLNSMCLTSGLVWPIPITLDVPADLADQLGDQHQIVLTDKENNYLAILTMSDIWQPDKMREAQLVYGSQDSRHPGVHQLLVECHDYYVAGELQGLSLPTHHDYREFRLTPQQCRDRFKQRHWSRIVAFQTRNPIHRAHFELTKQAMAQADANLLIHPVVGKAKPNDIDHYTRMRCYQAVLPYYSDQQAVMLGLLPLVMRMAGPREALWHAIIRQNYGCSHFIVGRAHADPGCGEAHCYPPYAAQDLIKQYQQMLHIECLLFDEVHYDENKKIFVFNKVSEEGTHPISMKKIRRLLAEKKPIPEWFSFPEVLAEIKKMAMPANKTGFCIFFTGLPGAGKSTLARALEAKFLEQGQRMVTVLDGDLLRAQRPNVGFGKSDRVAHVTHIANMAAEICDHHGIALCAVIAPYHQLRQTVRNIVAEKGLFIEVYLSTPLSACEQHDRKGLYYRARQGRIKHFTGINDPYEIPEHPSIILDTSQRSIKKCVDSVWQVLQKLKLVGH